MDEKLQGDQHETSKAVELPGKTEKLQSPVRRSPLHGAKPRGGKREYPLKIVIESSDSDSSDNEGNNTERDATNTSDPISKTSSHSPRLKDDNVISFPVKDNSPRVVKKRRVRDSAAAMTGSHMQPLSRHSRDKLNTITPFC